MKHLRYMLLPPLLLALTSCSPSTPDASERFTIKTGDWVTSATSDIHATVVIEKIGDQLYSLNYDFSVPLHPIGGASPAGMQLFSICLARKLARQGHYSHWALGGLEKNLRYRGDRKVELFVAVLNENESIPLAGIVRTREWLPPSSAGDASYTYCSRMLRPGLMEPTQ